MEDTFTNDFCTLVSASARLAHLFTDYDLKAMRERLADKSPYPVPDPNAPIPAKVQTAADHASHCFGQLYRFASNAENGGEFRAAQFGLNLGRVQEILGSHGGVEAWWRVFEPLLVTKAWWDIKLAVAGYCELLFLPQPGPL